MSFPWLSLVFTFTSSTLAIRAFAAPPDARARAAAPEDIRVNAGDDVDAEDLAALPVLPRTADRHHAVPIRVSLLAWRDVLAGTRTQANLGAGIVVVVPIDRFFLPAIAMPSRATLMVRISSGGARSGNSRPVAFRDLRVECR